jgi:hypothetical protein
VGGVGPQRRDGVRAPEGAHNFVNTAAGETEFYIVYFVPAGGSPAAIDVTPAPAGRPASLPEPSLRR